MYYSHYICKIIGEERFVTYNDMVYYVNYFSEETLSHLKPQLGLSERYQRRAIDVTLAAKLTLTYGKYHLAMLHRQLAMSEEQTTYQQAERQAAMMNQMTIFHSSPADFMHTQEESTDESIATYREFKRLVEEYADEHFVPSVVEEFCKRVYEDDDHFIFFKPFCNLYYSVYADALLWYQQSRIGYDTFCQELDFILRFLAMPKLKQVWLWSSGLTKTFQELSS